jgi:hypothetical protein
MDDRQPYPPHEDPPGPHYPPHEDPPGPHYPPHEDPPGPHYPPQPDPSGPHYPPQPDPPGPHYPPQPQPQPEPEPFPAPIDNGGEILPPPPPQPAPDASIDKDFDCICLGKKLINVAPKIIFAFTITIVVLFFCIIFSFVNKESLNVFLPIISGLVGFWIPSPLQSSNRKDAVTSETLLQAHLQNSRMFTSSRYGQMMQGSQGSQRSQRFHTPRGYSRVHRHDYV